MKFASRLAISASFLGFAVALTAPALAQDAAADGGESVDANEIVVTGSLIRRPNNTAVSPIVSVGAETIKEAGTPNLSDALNQFPSFTTAGNAATGGQGTGGRASINLHGLGSNRNLVLLDGKRLPLSDVNGNVDINIIPESIIGGIDVITGGASAVYGSDAMSGVVNFKIMRDFEGIRADTQYNISERGDAAKFNASLALGTKFAEGRGSLLAAFSYTTQDPIQGTARSFFNDKVPSSFIGTGTFVPSATNAPDAAVIQSVFTTYGITGARNPLLNLGFNNDRTLFVQTGAVNYRGDNGTNGYAVIGGNVRMPVGQQLQVLNALDRKTAFVKGDFELTPDLTAYGQFLFVDLTVNTESGGSLTQFPALTTIPVTNPFIPADLRTILASRPNPTAAFTWNGRYVGVPDKNWDENYNVQQYMLGLRGNIAEGWSFDAFAAYDQSKHTQTMHQAVLKSQVQKLLNSADGGASLCAGGFNPFGDANARSLSAACRAFITKDAVSVEDLGQTQAQLQVNGKLFDLGAGPVQLAMLASYRKNTYKFSPDFDLTANSGFAPGANIEGVVNTLPLAKTGISVKEFAAQVDIPLLSDKPFFQELAVGGAIRYSDYSVTGSVTSFELDARWRPVESLLIRGSYQRAVRTPNIGELFSPQQGNQLVIGTPPGAIGDPCDVRSTARTGANAAQVSALCVAQGVPSAAIGSYQFPTTATGQVTSGNAGLVPERANTFNVGMVFNAPSNSGVFGDFSLSLDYYNIKIKDVISPIPGLTVLSKCFNLDGSNTSYSNSNEYCQLIRRDSTGQLSQVLTPFLNLGALETDGVEAQIHWGVPAPFLGQTGKLYVDSAIGWLNNYKVQLLPGAAFLNYTGISNGGAGPNSVPPRATPKWKALTTFGYKSDTLGLGLRWRYQGALADVSAVLTPNNVQLPVAAYNLWDMFATVKVQKNIEFRFGVNNLFDKGLPFVASSQISTDPALYDLIGRSFYVGARISF
ncbi:TonB-dependent receptor domain-containing protein [Novosphingobium aquae]|uniref:TonB-dependent receptor n=1 Tax=Novosphingobium aquae TaxID=3133435 RepID=A0ABU8SB78_9SPHN